MQERNVARPVYTTHTISSTSAAPSLPPLAKTIPISLEWNGETLLATANTSYSKQTRKVYVYCSRHFEYNYGQEIACIYFQSSKFM